MTVRELLNRMDSRELTEWMLFFNLPPVEQIDSKEVLSEKLKTQLIGKKAGKR